MKRTEKEIEEREQKKAKKKKHSLLPPPISTVDEQAEEQKDEYAKPRFTAVYNPPKLLEVITSIQNPNHERTFSSITGWGMIKLELKTLSCKELRRIFEELDPAYRQVGLDDSKEWFRNEQIAIAKKISAEGYVPKIANFAKRGIPACMRPKMYKQMLNVQTTQKEKCYFDLLLQNFSQVSLLIDDMTHYDVKKTCDDDDFFVFEDLIETIMEAFYRDRWIYHNCAIKPKALVGVDKGKFFRKIKLNFIRRKKVWLLSTKWYHTY